MKVVLILALITATAFVLARPGPETIHKAAWVLGIADGVLVAYTLFFPTEGH